MLFTSASAEEHLIILDINSVLVWCKCTQKLKQKGNKYFYSTAQFTFTKMVVGKKAKM